MSVILFSTNGEVYTTMAQSYEELKSFTTAKTFRTFSSDDDNTFYKALRQIYFANVACYLCQYHSDTPLSKDTLASIETFEAFKKPTGSSGKSPQSLVNDFVDAWGLLDYNLCTNDGELYKAVNSYNYIEALAQYYTRALER